MDAQWLKLRYPYQCPSSPCHPTEFGTATGTVDALAIMPLLRRGIRNVIACVAVAARPNGTSEAFARGAQYACSKSSSTHSTGVCCCQQQWHFTGDIIGPSVGGSEYSLSPLILQPIHPHTTPPSHLCLHPQQRSMHWLVCLARCPLPLPPLVLLLHRRHRRYVGCHLVVSAAPWLLPTPLWQRWRSPGLSMVWMM